MNIGKAFSYIFDDESWITKILIGGILAIIPIVNFAVLGYTVETIRNVTQGMERPLPEWSEFGGKFVKGLVVCIIGFIYAIPILLISGCFMGLTIALGGGNGKGEDLIALLLFPLYCLLGLYGLVLAILTPAMLIKYAVTGEVGSAFRFGELFGLITGNLGNYIVAIILTWVAGLISSLGVIACGVGVFFTGFWAYLVMAHLYGQLHRASVVTT